MKKATKEKKEKINNTFVSSDNETSNFIKILIAVLVLVVIFGVITYFVTRKDNKEEESNVEFQYNKIVVGSILNRDEDTYYVLVEAKDDSNVSTYENLITEYSKKDNHLRFYTVDLNDGFNQNFVSDKENLKVTNIKDIKFNKTTLLKISKKKITDTITNSAKINDYIAKLSA